MNKTLLPLMALGLCAGMANAAVVSVDFDSLTAGTVTAATLDGVTTGGTWTLNAYSTPDVPPDVLTHTIENDDGGAGEKALFSTITGGAGTTNPPMMMTSKLDFTNTFDIDVTGAQFEFEVAQQKGTGFSRPVKYSFLNSLGSEILYFTVNDGNLSVNGSGSSAVGGGGNNGVNPWNSTSALVWAATVNIDTAGAVNWSFGGQSGSTTIASTADIKTFQSNMDPDRYVGQGTYLNYFAAAPPIPEPSSTAFIGTAGFLMLLRRRRRA